MTITIWGRANSSNVMKVLWAADELGLAYVRHDVGGPFGGNRTAEYLSRNPNGLVPTIEIDGEIVWESNTILRLLGDRYGRDTLWPSDPLVRARAERWMDWQLGTLGAPMTTLLFQLVRTPEDQRQPALIAQALETATKHWALLDAHLATSAYVGGPDFTLADMCPGCLVARWFRFPVERPPLPHLEAWYQRLQQRAPFQRWVDIAPT
ncbi:MAG: glutathione S-transferase family protein [Alphaproteobacteria bacterium]|nr:glutathione S-transferase family protein [Alphaproteobacteria bacterium]